MSVHAEVAFGRRDKTQAGTVELKLAGLPVSTDTTLHIDASDANWAQLGKTAGAAQIQLKLTDGTVQTISQTLGYTPAKLVASKPAASGGRKAGTTKKVVPKSAAPVTPSARKTP